MPALPESVPSLNQRARWLRRATYASVATAVLLILVKLAAWLVTGSVSLLKAARRPAAVRGAHDLRTRQGGQVPFVQLHLELDGDLSLREAHAIADTVDAAIRELLPGAEVIIYQEPVPS